ncbi:ribonuclease H-like domain-containing protein [Candidatus Woesearchaeota archaeon]|nr:ribonuclease H-like domain-containing protein [Candidatus Woesearchaeota archaeon]
MIQNSFIFLDRIGKEKERQIWSQGIYSWEAFLTTKRVKGISPKSKAYYDRKLMEARKQLFSSNSSYFASAMPLSEQWRLYEFFREDAVYLDIETDGLNETDDITVVGLFDGLDTKTMVRGINLDYAALRNELLKYKITVTFNGSVFDVPFIRKRYGNILPDIPHFDLRFCCQRIGLSGGLKQIENKLGIWRANEIVRQMYGGDAALLHRMWRGSGNEHYLQLLVDYNEEDVVNLRKIAEHTYKSLKDKLINSWN